MATFNKIFKDIYTEPLKAEGFKYNSKYGYFFRIINNELIQYITHISLPYLEKGIKRYDIFAGTVSIYSESVDKDFLRMAGRCINYYSEINMSYDMWYTEENIIQSIEESVDKTMNLIIPVLNEVVDLNTYISFRKKTQGLIEISLADEFWADSLALIMADNHDDFQDIFQRQLEIIKEELRLNKCGGTYEEHYKLLYDAIINQTAKSRDRVYQDEELYAKAITEAEHRKCVNLEYLRSMKVIE